MADPFFQDRVFLAPLTCDIAAQLNFLIIRRRWCSQRIPGVILAHGNGLPEAEGFREGKKGERTAPRTMRRERFKRNCFWSGRMLPRGRDVFSRVTRLPRRVSGAHDTYCYVSFDRDLLDPREYLYATRDRLQRIYMYASNDAYQLNRRKHNARRNVRCF